MRRLINTTGDVFHIEEDAYLPGNILFADEHSIKTTNGSLTTVVAGCSDSGGYVEGAGEVARFSYILGFTQWKSDVIIVSDHGNHCLRSVDRQTTQTSRLVGQCGPDGSGFVNGVNARFKNPHALTVLNESFVLVSDNLNDAIRLVDIDGGTVSTFTAHIPSPKDMLMVRDGSIFYVVSGFSVAVVDIASASFTILSATDRRFIRPLGLDWLDEETMVLTDEMSAKISIILVSNNLVVQKCPEDEVWAKEAWWDNEKVEDDKNNTVRSCDLGNQFDGRGMQTYYMAVHKYGKDLYIGGRGFIDVIQLGQVISGSDVLVYSTYPTLLLFTFLFQCIIH